MVYYYLLICEALVRLITPGTPGSCLSHLLVMVSGACSAATVETQLAPLHVLVVQAERA